MFGLGYPRNTVWAKPVGFARQDNIAVQAGRTASAPEVLGSSPDVAKGTFGPAVARDAAQHACCIDGLASFRHIGVITQTAAAYAGSVQSDTGTEHSKQLLLQQPYV